MPEASPEFKQLLRDAFEHLEVGQTFTFRRTFTDGDVALFCGVTGDYNPYHLDEEFARGTWFGRRNIPGLLTASMLTHVGRSEEHTSELQSQSNLVCRLLLEKKKH